MAYVLWIDDIRNPGQRRYKAMVEESLPVYWARDVEQAIYYVRTFGFPASMYLDHDLPKWENGELIKEKVMSFLRWLEKEYPKPPVKIKYRVISDNPEGQKNITSFMESWKKVSGA